MIRNTKMIYKEDGKENGNEHETKKKKERKL